jgi:hypothetical protein
MQRRSSARSPRERGAVAGRVPALVAAGAELQPDAVDRAAQGRSVDARRARWDPEGRVFAPSKWLSLPINHDAAELIEAQQQCLRARFPGTKLSKLALLPQRKCNPTGRLRVLRATRARMDGTIGIEHVGATRNQEPRRSSN